MEINENAARPAGTLKIMLTSFLFMLSQGISLLNFLNCMDFSVLFMIHSTGRELHNRVSEARNLYTDDISQGGFAPLNPLAKSCRHWTALVF